MKKLLSILICIVMVVCACCIVSFTASAEDTLTVMDDFGHTVSVKVGQDVLYTIYVNAGADKLVNTQGTLRYTPEALDVDLFGEYEVDNKGNVELYYEDYMLPTVSNKGASVVVNPEIDGFVYFNFSKAKGIAALDKDNSVLLKARFKALAPGEATISTEIEYMVNTADVKIFDNGIPNDSVNPRVSTSLEAAQYIIGDVDDDWNVTIKDATLIQKICSGSSDPYTLSHADADLDGKLTLKDALGVRKFLAGNTPSVVGIPNFNVGASVFASEQA
ncbi:MAG: hypothetical protein IJH32_08860 [Ruminococcus sp.]|nr:hypothetical protein [Ruminococcus sp.]